MAESAIGVERPATAGEIALARLDIEYLRRKYAKATDLLQSRLGWGIESLSRASTAFPRSCSDAWRQRSCLSGPLAIPGSGAERVGCQFFRAIS